MKLAVAGRGQPMRPDLPHVFEGAPRSLEAVARAGEDYAFAVVFVPQNGGRVSLEFADCTGDCGVISAAAFGCINLGGVDYAGRAFTKALSVGGGEQCVLWSTVRVPDGACGVYRGEATLRCGSEVASLPLTLTVSGTVSEHGFAEPQKLTRLRWLDSRLAQNGGPTVPYTAPIVRDGAVAVLGRIIAPSECGLPGEIRTAFDDDVQLCGEKRVITGGFGLKISYEDGAVASLRPAAITHFADEDGAGWVAHTGALDIAAEIVCRVDFDGYITCRVALTAQKTLALSDIALEYALAPEFSRYAMGLGLKGGVCPTEHSFVWDERLHQSALWVGGVGGGLRCELKGEDFVEPLVNIYYRHRPLHMSRSFANPQMVWTPAGVVSKPRGGVKLRRTNAGAIVTAYSGARVFAAGETLRFDFDALVTPLKPLDLKTRMNTRYYHRGDAETDIAEAVSVGATHMNIHHASRYNAFINYPFLSDGELLPLIKKAHDAGLGLKLYYTVREQSDRTCETDAFMSLGSEIYPAPKGGQGSVLWNRDNLMKFRERFGDNVIPAWLSDMDMAVITDGRSRLCNYYIEGLRRLVERCGIDGLYIDDVAYDRVTMRRARRVLDSYPVADGLPQRRLVDLHSWNHYCDLAGWGNSLNIYMPLLPYIDSVWIGEGFDHANESADYWLVEIAGTPYGVGGELLPESDACIPFRGMLFGATTRYPWAGRSPVGLWRFIRDYNLADSALHGFWNDKTPVATGDDDVKASLYAGSRYAVIALASFADEPRTVKPSLTLDGFDIADAYIPAIDGVQDAAPWTGDLALPCKGGALLVIPKRA